MNFLSGCQAFKIGAICCTLLCASNCFADTLYLLNGTQETCIDIWKEANEIVCKDKPSGGIYFKKSEVNLKRTFGSKKIKNMPENAFTANIMTPSPQEEARRRAEEKIHAAQQKLEERTELIKNEQIKQRNLEYEQAEEAKKQAKVSCTGKIPGECGKGRTCLTTKYMGRSTGQCMFEAEADRIILTNAAENDHKREMSNKLSDLERKSDPNPYNSINKLKGMMRYGY